MTKQQYILTGGTRCRCFCGMVAVNVPAPNSVAFAAVYKHVSERIISPVLKFG